MATLLLVNLPILPTRPSKPNPTQSTIYSPQISLNEEYATPRPSVQTNKILSDSDSVSTDRSSTDDTDDEYLTDILKSRSIDSQTSTSKPEIQLKLENDEAEFFAFIPPAETRSKSRRKRDRIRSAFSRKIHRSSSTVSDTSSIEWNEMLAKTLISMQSDLNDIIAGFDQIDQSLTDDSLSDISEAVLTRPHLSFRERQLEKLEMIKIAQMLHPPNLLTYDMKVSPYPYTDIIESDNCKNLRTTKGVPNEQLFVQCKPVQHQKFRYRTQRGLLKMRHDLKKIRHDVCGESPTKSYKEAPSNDVQNYRHRLEKTLLEFRRQITEYDRLHSLMTNRPSSISETIAKLHVNDPKIKIQIDDYRSKSQAVEYVDKNSKHELLSAPYIPPRVRNQLIASKTEKNINPIIDNRFDPTTFLNLNEESEKFFGRHIPFWEQPMERRLSAAFKFKQQEPVDIILPPTLGIWDRFVLLFKTKQKLLRKIQSKQRRLSNDDLLNRSDEDEFYDCPSHAWKQQKSQSLIILDDPNTVDF